eukprot:sb/3473880/
MPIFQHNMISLLPANTLPGMLFYSIKCNSNLPQVPISSTYDLTVTIELFLGSGLVSSLNYSCILVHYHPPPHNNPPSPTHLSQYSVGVTFFPTPYLRLIVPFYIYHNWIHSHLITNNITVPIIHQKAVSSSVRIVCLMIVYSWVT